MKPSGTLRSTFLSVNILTSARQSAQKEAETQFVTGLLLEGSRTTSISSRLAAKSAPIRSSVLVAKPTYKSASTVANKTALLAKTVPNKRAQITSYLQASPRITNPISDPIFGLPVGTVNTIQIASQLAPHIVAATSSEYDSRLREALADMQHQLDQQRIQVELERDKSQTLLKPCFNPLNNKKLCKNTSHRDRTSRTFPIGLRKRAFRVDTCHKSLFCNNSEK
jgi:hypothetical protein